MALPQLLTTSLNLALATLRWLARTHERKALEEAYLRLIVCSVAPLHRKFCLLRSTRPPTVSLTRSVLTIQGPALSSALQTAFQLGNASTSWLGIFALYHSHPVYVQKSSLFLRAQVPRIYLVAGWPPLLHRVFSSPPDHSFSV